MKQCPLDFLAAYDFGNKMLFLEVPILPSRNNFRFVTTMIDEHASLAIRHCIGKNQTLV